MRNRSCILKIAGFLVFFFFCTLVCVQVTRLSIPRVGVVLVQDGVQGELRVPEACLTHLQGGLALFYVENNRARLAFVETSGEAKDGYVTVTGSISQGAAVVRYATRTLTDGELLQVVEVEPS